MKQIQNDTISIYIHWPFCKKICNYCNFNRYLYKNVNQKEWVKAYISTISNYSGILSSKKIKSIFFGGGTPSLMEVALVNKIIETIASYSSLDDTEITIEMNPTSFEVRKIHDLKAVGVNRISLGVQSLIEKNLLFLGRNHSVLEAINAMKCIEKVFDNFSYDFIYGLPGQLPKEWKNELYKILEFPAPHISLYLLSIEDNTRFMNLYKCGKLHPINNDDAAILYEITENVMSSNGFIGYEISNYSQVQQDETQKYAKQDYRCKHSLHYWLYGDYIGIGPGAHGRITRKSNKSDIQPIPLQRITISDLKSTFDINARTAVNTETFAIVDVKNPKAWLEQVEKESNGIEVVYQLSDDEINTEKTLMGLRISEGMLIEPFMNQNRIEEMKARNLLKEEDGKISATNRGRLLLDSIIEYLLER